jgi:hypothetical protein
MVLQMVDEELATLQPAHEAQILKVEQLKQAHKAAVKEEQREARERSMNQAERLQRRLKVTSRMQACVRGWLVRKRVIAALDHRTVQNLRHAAMLPDLLREQLKSLQHGTHDLKYRTEEREAAATKLQNWWRSIVKGRVEKIVQLARILQGIGDHMAAAATVIQAWYRGMTTKLRMRCRIRAAMEATKQQQIRDMVVALHSIVQIQRKYRGKLARAERKRLLAERGLAISAASGHLSLALSTVSAEEEDSKLRLVDTWRPATGPGVEPAGSGKVGVHITSPPRHDWEIDKIQSAELVPFYEASMEEVIHHQIGGPSALAIADELMGNTDYSITDESGTVGSLCDMSDSTWNVYPNGLTQDFLPQLDPDALEKGGRGKSYRNSLHLRGIRKSSRRKRLDCRPAPCTKICALPPSNTEQRAKTREVPKLCNGETNNMTDNGRDPHPLFINAPSLPSQRSLSANPAGSARYFCGGDDGEDLWGSSAVSDQPSYRKDRRPRGRLEDVDLWNTLNVPYADDSSRHRDKCRETSSERVWSIADRLKEKLPALTAEPHQESMMHSSRDGCDSR